MFFPTYPSASHMKKYFRETTNRRRNHGRSRRGGRLSQALPGTPVEGNSASCGH
jgi:hypothetical protein